MKAGNKKKKKTATLPIPCGWQECNESFNSEMELNGHITHHLETHKGNEVCTWNYCTFSTSCFKELERHIYYHGYYNGLIVRGIHERNSNPNVPKCAAPTRTGDLVPALKSDFCCEWVNCERNFASIVEFQDHIVQHAAFEYEIQKSPEEKHPKVKCNWYICTKQLDNRYRLMEHIQTHANKKIVACPNCGELFRTRTTFFDHARRQQSNNTHKYQCAQCYKFFPTLKLLRWHLVKHVNRHKCSMCDMSCSTASGLATHVRYRHLKDKPFKCTECDYRGVREDDIEKHKHFVHSKKVHRCDQSGCNYAVKSYKLLRRHYLEVHGNSPFIYICQCCDKLFKNGHSLSLHLIKKHKFQLPSGHKRFTYRVDENGFYRLETTRIESLEVTKQILSPNPFEAADVTQDASCYEIVSMTSNEDQRVIVSNDAIEAHFAGEVVISLKTREED